MFRMTVVDILRKDNKVRQYNILREHGWWASLQDDKRDHVGTIHIVVKISK